MKKVSLVIFFLALVLNVQAKKRRERCFPITDSTPLCTKQYEIYQNCGTFCPRNCSNYGDEISCPEICVRGCFCEEGYIRDANGNCIPPENCPGIPTCDRSNNEVFTKCGASPCVQKRCPSVPDPDRVTICPIRCTAGCVCKSGYVLLGSKCVLPQDCPKLVCKNANEVYSDCGDNPCERTCDQPDRPTECFAACRPGCGCKEGFVRHPNGNCVRPRQCPAKPICSKANEIYQECGTACPSNCSNYGEVINCIKICVRGCFCEEGYIRDANGNCIPPENCPGIPACDRSNNEVFTKCGAIPCIQKRCPSVPDPNRVTICPLRCTAGCVCKSGYVRLGSKCVLPEDCPKLVCKNANEVYSDCGDNPCERTCEQPDRPTECFAACRPGCGCKEGFVRHPNGNCVLLRQCPAEPVCKKPFEFFECGTACPRTCENRFEEITCIDMCREGCFCKSGYIRNKNGDCIPEKDCPPYICSAKNETYNDCGPNFGCEESCSGKIQDPRRCTKRCNQGCYCKKGYVRDERNKCILKKDCPAPQPICDKNKNEVYSQCGAHECQATCEDPNLPTVCLPRGCVPGCVCAQGYIRNSDGNCVLREQCPDKPICSKLFEKYQDCGTACPRTCDNKDQVIVCTLQCVKGCFCDEDYVRDAKGDCVLPQNCPIPCPRQNETFNSCGPVNGCQESCTGKVDPAALCFDRCYQGCFCKEGYVRDARNNCILKRDCPRPQPICDKRKHEVYSRCGAHGCQENCADIGSNRVCRPQCTEGCVCEEGYIRDSKGNCILKKDCPPPVCSRPNEVFNSCGPGRGCENSCLEKYNESDRCLKMCRQGCYCKPGYIRDYQDKCIPENSCPPRPTLPF